MSNYGTYSGLPDEPNSNQVRVTGNKKRRLLYAGIVVAVIILIVTISVGVTAHNKKKDGPHDTPNPPESSSFVKAVSIANIMNHLEQLELIAAQYNNSRSVLNGYNASADYVYQQLVENTNYNVVVQPFPVKMYLTIEPSRLAQVSPKQTTYKLGTDFINMGGFSGLSDQKNVAVFHANAFGCEVSDYNGIIEDSIALIMRGNCSFRDKILVASDAGAKAVLIYNDGTDPDRQGVFLGNVGESIPIPAFALTFALGETLANTPTAKLQVFSNNQEITVITRNIIADTLTGDENSVIVVGSHLDSVPAGPGINDNGSGSATNLELAIQMYKSKLEIKNKVRFAWWGAEEIGLLGSTFYVHNLNSTSPQELSKIALNINFDMLGSPNYFFGIYNGTSAAPSIVNGSIVIQNLFTDHLNRMRQPHEPTPFTGRSDYGPFIEVGIPAGGLFTGAEVHKTAAQRQMYGGLANAAYDPCYHQYCDTIENIDTLALEVMSQAAASVLETLSTQQSLRSYLGQN